MSNYSDRQLLLLSNFVYLPCSLYDAPISEILDYYRNEEGNFTEESVKKAGIGGGLNNKDICTLFDEMDKECKNNPDFAGLSASRKLNGGYVKAICYTNQNDENPVVAFRGTGGSPNAWIDNFDGGFENDTRMQRLASDFIKNECAMYSGLTVTGHSKGGNLSQYVTVACGDKVNRCVSFDGQGFNEEFIRENAESIGIATGKIKSISAYNDFVNILLTSIAGTVVYAQNEASIVSAHSSLTLLTMNQYDANGNIVSLKKQSPVSASLKLLADKIVKIIEPFDAIDKELISHVTGSTISAALRIGTDYSATGVAGVAAGGITSMISKKLADSGFWNLGDVKISAPNLYFNRDGMLRVIEEYTAIAGELAQIQERVEEINDRTSQIITVKLYAGKKLERVCEDINNIINNISLYTQALDSICNRYMEKEKTLDISQYSAS